MGNPNRRGGGGGFSTRKDSDDPATRTTFYVTNISDRVTGLKLREAFGSFVHVTDAWVPRKRSAKGRVFGFVRCQKIKDPYPILETLNEISILDSRITVSLAMFDRMHRKIEYGHEASADKVWAPKEKNVLADDFPSMRTVYCGSSKKSVSIDSTGELYPSHCVGRAVIGVSEDISRLHLVKKMLHDAGLVDAAVSYLGGLTVLISFRDKEEMEDFLVAKEDVWKESLVSVTPWLGQALPFERIAVLKIVGMPVMIRDNAVFDKVGSFFGKVVWPSEFSWFNLDNSVGFSHVLTQSSSRIDEEVSIVWKGSVHNVWVVEESSSWVPEFEESVGVQGSDELEEGEIREGVPENGDGSSGGIDDGPSIQAGITETDMERVDIPIADDVHGGAGNLNLVGQPVGSMGSGQLGSGPVVSNGVAWSTCFTPSRPVDLNTNLGFNVGCSDTFKSRKRSRMSFHSSPEDTGFQSKVCEQPSQDTVLPVPDLNETEGNVLMEECSPTRPLEASGSETVPAVVGVVSQDVVPEAEPLLNSEVVDEAIGINGEVNATVQVSSLVGINLNNFEGMVAGEIITEIGTSVNQ